MSERNILFNVPLAGSNASYHVKTVLGGNHHSGDGVMTKEASRILAEITTSHRSLLTTSCTHALEMSAILLDVGPGDEVILPAFTFVSTANAFLLRGAKLKWADIDSQTLNMLPASVESLISGRTKVIVPVHYGGIACDLGALLRIGEISGASIVEDNAHGLFGEYKGQQLGSFGRLSTLSFHETKNISCGEGGALLVNDSSLVSRAEIIREKGTNRSRFFRGEIDRYSWVDLGSSYLPNEITAAVLLASLEDRNKSQDKRKRIWKAYAEGLSVWGAKSGVQLPFVPSECTPAYHLFHLIMPDLDTRTRFISHMKNSGISTVFHYLPLHLSDIGKSLGGRLGECPVTESMSDRIVRLPMHCELSDDDVMYIMNEIQGFAF